MASPPLLRGRSLPRRGDVGLSVVTPLDVDPDATGFLEDPGGVERVEYRRRSPASPRTYRGAFLASLLIAALLAVVWAAPVQALESLSTGLAWLERHDSERERAVLTTALAALALLLYVVAWGRATSRRRPVRLAGGRGRIAIEEVEARLRAALQERADIRTARVEVENRHRGGLAVVARLAVSADARLTETIEAATELAEDVIHEGLGVPMAAPPSLELQYEELDLRAGRGDGRRAARGRTAAGSRGERDGAGAA
jgi:hypothetical protein